MKRILKLFAIVLAVLLCLKVPANAETPQLIDDEAGVLSSAEVSALTAQAQRVSDTYDFGVYVVTVPGSVQSYGYSAIEDLSEAAYRDLDLGVGAEKEGILLLLTMEDGYLNIFVPHTERCDGAFSQYAREQMAETVVYDYFRYDQFNDGFKNFISIVDTDLAMYEAGTPLSAENDPAKEEQRRQEQAARAASEKAAKTGVTFGLPPIAALLTCLGLRSKNKTTGIKHEANQYIAKNGIRLSVVQDQFLYRNETRTRIHREDSGGGGSSFHSSSTSMGSHTSGSFRG